MSQSEHIYTAPAVVMDGYYMIEYRLISSPLMSNYCDLHHGNDYSTITVQYHYC